MIRKLLPLLAVTALSGCGAAADSLSRWQDSLFVSPPPTEAQVREAMAYVGASDLPMPVVVQWSKAQMAKVDGTVALSPAAPSATCATGCGNFHVASFYVQGSHSIVVGPSWNRFGDGEALLVHEAYNYARFMRGLPKDDCASYRFQAAYEDAQGWYGRENQTELAAKFAGCGSL